MLSQFANLRIWASRPVPGLVAAVDDDSIDLEIWLQSRPPWLAAFSAGEEQLRLVSARREINGEPSIQLWSGKDPAYLRLRYGDGTEFVLDEGGSWVWATWPDTSTLEDTATYLLGPVLGLVLHLCGVPCLHASAISVDDRAFALLGGAGAGKSTMASAFAQRGFPVLTDDIVALSRQADSFLVWPTYPHLRLWPKSVEFLFDEVDALPRITPTWDKRYLDLTRPGYRFQDAPLPLSAIYVLDGRQADDDAPRVTPISGAAALVTLIGNTYMSTLLDRSIRASEFDFLAELLGHISVRRVTPHSDPSRVHELCDLILDDFQAHLSPDPQLSLEPNA
jgi:hypothetical protein